MAAYVILEIEVHDPIQMEVYRQQAPTTVAAYDGKFVVRGGAITPLEGDWNPKRITILEFPSVARAQEWWDSPEYTVAKQIREKAAHTKLIIVEGVMPS